jgi:tryptophan synthase beta chain
MASKKRARSIKKGKKVKSGRRTKAKKTIEKIMTKGKVAKKGKTPRMVGFKKVVRSTKAAKTVRAAQTAKRGEAVAPTKTPRPGGSMRAPKRQYALPVEEMPRKWYNILADLPDPLPPPIDPEQGESRLKALPEMLLGECLKQEMSTERWIDIPEELLSLYAQAGRPRQLFRALSLEKHLGTPARLYYKAEFYSPTGSHKVNTALAQAFYAREAGYERLTTETGAGQWGTALAYAASLADLRCTVYWVRAVYSWKSARKNLMQIMGADIYASPSDKTETGRKLFEKDANHPGSLGIAISEGLEDARRDKKAIYCLGSVLNHVLLHQTVIGLETQRQFEMAKDYPDVVISCIGGGSNFGGFAFPFVGDVLKRGKKIRFIAAQSEAAPNLQGEYKYDFADHAEMTPLLKMYTLGHKISMRPIRGDGLRYHGCSPIVSYLRNKGLIDTIAYPVDEKHVFDRARTFIRHEGFLPAPESAYSIACAIDEAIKCKETGDEKVIAFNVSGHGFMDMEGYAAVLGL